MNFKLLFRYIIVLCILPLELSSQIAFENNAWDLNRIFARQVVVKDMDNDGSKDVVLHYFDEIAILYQTSDFQFDSPSILTFSYPSSYNSIEAFDIDDINNDGLQDIIFCHSNGFGILLQLDNNKFSDIQIIEDVSQIGTFGIVSEE